MANRFAINPPDTLQALMLGMQGYEGAQKRVKQGEMDAGRQTAMQRMMAGDAKGAFGAAIGAGDVPTAQAIAQFEKSHGEAGNVFGNVIWGTGPDGNTRIGTHDHQGKFRPIDTGDFKPTPGTKWLDTGTGHIGVDSRSGTPVGPAMQPGAPGQPPQPPQQGATAPRQAPVGYIPKDIVGKESAEEVGKARGQAQVNLPNVLLKSQAALKTIDQLETHPGKEWAVGFTGAVPGVYGTKQRDYIALHNQAKGQTFLAAYDSLRGAGAITDVEGVKAEQAIARLDRAQSKEGYDEALRDLRGVIKNGMDVARQKASGAKSGVPSVGEVRDGYSFKGGDPASQDNWVKIK